MVDIQALSTRDNVALLRGATQHWSDLDRLGNRSLVNRIALAQVSGRTLVAGPAPKALRDAVAQVTSEVEFLVRGVPDADEVARSQRGHQVWCGDLSALAARGEWYDTVLITADLASLLSLEQEQRTWAQLATEAENLLAPEGTLVLAIENDLGLHRIHGERNPRTADTDADWNPMATWDRSRPRSLAQVRDVVGEDARIFALWPEFRSPSAVIDVDRVPADQAESLALTAGTLDGDGPDPAYLVMAAAAADRVHEFAGGWLAIRHPRRPSPVALLDVSAKKEWDAPVEASGRSLLGAFHDRAAACDLPGVRALIRAWSDRLADGRHDAQLGLSLVDEEGLVVPLRALEEPRDGRLDALAELTAICRDRAWRTPWPATDDPAAVLRQLAAMAGLPELTSDDALQLIPAAPPRGPQIDPQQLLDVVERNQAELSTMRSKLRWVEMQLEWATQRAMAGTPKGYAQGAVRKAKSVAKKTSQRVLKELGLR
ncbi:MAG TPA: hypothetical protein PKE40_02055 [Arachnia sp.]|nr:hypothetical protein [Arachnia sp.]HMT85113.1 hypothetical protein [Arachnia sp.]